MHGTQPTRLTNDEFMPQNLSLRMYYHALCEPVPLHWHEFYEMSFIQAGEGSHILNGIPHPLVPGSLFLLTPADFHALAPAPGSTIQLFNVIFSSNMLREEVYQLLFTDLKEYITVCCGECFPPMEAEFRRLWSEVNDTRLGQQVIICGALERILIDLARSCAGHNKKMLDEQDQMQHEKVRPGLVYIHHHFREPLTLEAVAHHVHLSPNYFSECFRKAYGTSFQSYLQDLRLRFAMSLLSASRLSITDICYASGFNTLSHFERAFKQRFGQTPREVTPPARRKASRKR
jgi:AraC-like DNA-binding protein